MRVFLILVFVIVLSSGAQATKPEPLSDLPGMPKEQFFQVHPKSEARTYRTISGTEEWITYDYPFGPLASGTISVHFADGKGAEWKINDRAEVVKEYLSEFSSPAFAPDSKTYAAIRDALTKIPLDAFLSVTDRSRPVIFTEYHYTGVGRFASSSNIVSFEDDAPSMTDGLTMIKISLEMEDTAQTSQEIEGVILHELAHRVLEHAKKKIRTCQMEREANNLVKSWGYEREYRKAKERFGDKTRTDAEKCPE